MSTFIFMVVIILAFLSVIFAWSIALDSSIESDSGLKKLLAFSVAIAWTAFLLSVIITNSAEDKPCIEYKQQMHYNAATKTMMPMRICVKRGEWVE